MSYVVLSCCRFQSNSPILNGKPFEFTMPMIFSKSCHFTHKLKKDLTFLKKLKNAQALFPRDGSGKCSKK